MNDPYVFIEKLYRGKFKKRQKVVKLQGYFPKSYHMLN